MARRRRRNASSFMHEHPWMTFFMAGGALYTLRVIFQGWEPDPFAAKPTAKAPALTAASTPAQTSAAISGLMGLYR